MEKENTKWAGLDRNAAIAYHDYLHCNVLEAVPYHRLSFTHSHYAIKCILPELETQLGLPPETF